MTVKQLLVDGHIPEQSIEWVESLLVLIGIAMIVITFIVVIKNMSKSSKKDFEDRLNKEKKEIERDVIIDQTLKSFRESLDRLTHTINSMSENLFHEVQDLSKQVDCHDREIVRLDQAVKSAHKRMDEHRRVEHGKNGSVRLSDDASDYSKED